jgi:aerobic-type carbon monoxide dehydrogenase small subunit (CoxS/CutS family)
VKVALTLNGAPSELECRSDEMLLDVLRREAGLTSVRETCRIGVCGACTVLVDGEPMSGCLLLAAQAAGRSVTTVEGLGPQDPTVRAFAAEHAFQCGWCTPGFVLTASALLDERGDPSEEEIAVALGGNLCRCGSYRKIVAAVGRAAAERDATDDRSSAAGRRLRAALREAPPAGEDQSTAPPQAEPPGAAVPPPTARSRRALAIGATLVVAVLAAVVRRRRRR